MMCFEKWREFEVEERRYWWRVGAGELHCDKVSLRAIFGIVGDGSDGRRTVRRVMEIKRREEGRKFDDGKFVLGVVGRVTSTVT
jgi:hypothetical protein